MVPLAIYRTAGALGQAPLLPPPGGSPEDRVVRLAAVIVAWNVFEHFYPYSEELGPSVWLAALSPPALGSLGGQGRAGLPRHNAEDDGDPARWPGSPQRTRRAARFRPAGDLDDGRRTHRGAFGEGAADVKPGDALVSIDGQPAAGVLAAKEAGSRGRRRNAFVNEASRPCWRARLRKDPRGVGAGRPTRHAPHRDSGLRTPNRRI